MALKRRPAASDGFLMRNGGSGSPRRDAPVPGRRLLLAVAVLLAASTLPIAAPADAGLEFTFEGGGWGHSVGMSQYGAYGMALEGYTWQEILTHYFTGAYPAAADPALLAEPIWLGLAQQQSRLKLTVVPTGSTPAVPVTFTLGGATLVAHQGQTVVVETLGAGTCRVTGPAGSISGPCSITATWDGWEEQPSTAVELGGCSLPDWNAPGGTVWRPCRYARGALHIRPDDDTATVNLTVEIGIEDYILGISESPYAWGTTGGRAALEAQAVAARSYALYRVIVRGDPASRPWCHCQLYDTTVDQFYVGWGHATQPWLDAVAATTGWVMMHPSATLEGALIPIQTFYSSSTFGWTENSEHGFTAYVPYLRAVDDHWSTLPAVGNPRSRWTRSFDAARLASLLPGISTVTGAQVTRCSETGAALEITFTGEGGPRAFSTRDLRTHLGLPSMQVISVGAPPSGSPACSGYAFSPPEPGGPLSPAGISIDDDATEDSAGDADGKAECGEAIEVLTTLDNEGAALRSVSASLSSSDPYVTILWNQSSGFPDLPASGSAANLDDWDLAISPQAPDGHTAHLTLRVVAANGGPWDLDVPLELACRPAADPPPTGVVAGLGDVNGDGVADVAVAYAPAGEPARVQVRAGTDGALLAGFRISRAGYVPVTAVTIPSIAGSPAPEVAVLLTGPGLRPRVVVIDAEAGRKVHAFHLGRTLACIDIAVLPAAEGSASPRLGVLAVRANERIRVFLRDGGTGARLGGIGFGRALSPVALAGYSGADGEGLLSVLGSTADGDFRVPVRRIADRTRVRTLALGAGLIGEGLFSIPDPSGRGSLLIAVATSPSGGPVRLVVAGPDRVETTGIDIDAGLTTVEDLETLPGLLGYPGHEFVLLGEAPDGTALAAVLDPLGGRLVQAIRFPNGYAAHDLAPLLDGRNLAVLGTSSAGEAVITIRRAATGTEVSSFTVL